MSEEIKKVMPGSSVEVDGVRYVYNPYAIDIVKSALQALLAKAKELADCDRPIQDRAWESEDAISISALEKIVKELSE